MKTMSTLNISERKTPGSLINIREFDHNFNFNSGPNFVSAGKNMDFIGGVHSQQFHSF
jgi:hypothetical protein